MPNYLAPRHPRPGIPHPHRDHNRPPTSQDRRNHRSPQNSDDLRGRPRSRPPYTHRVHRTRSCSVEYRFYCSPQSEQHDHEQDAHEQDAHEQDAEYEERQYHQQPVPCTRSHRSYQINHRLVRDCCGYHQIRSLYHRAVDMVREFKTPCSADRASACDDRRRRHYRRLKIMTEKITEDFNAVMRMYEKLKRLVSTGNRESENFKRDFATQWKEFDEHIRTVPFEVNFCEDSIHNRHGRHGNNELRPMQTNLTQEQWTKKCSQVV